MAKESEKRVINAIDIVEIIITAIISVLLERIVEKAIENRQWLRRHLFEPFYRTACAHQTTMLFIGGATPFLLWLSCFYTLRMVLTNAVLIFGVQFLISLGIVGGFNSACNIVGLGNPYNFYRAPFYIKVSIYVLYPFLPIITTAFLYEAIPEAYCRLANSWYSNVANPYVCVRSATEFRVWKEEYDRKDLVVYGTQSLNIWILSFPK